jgi:hypothetical protein
MDPVKNPQDRIALRNFGCRLLALLGKSPPREVFKAQAGLLNGLSGESMVLSAKPITFFLIRCLPMFLSPFAPCSMLFDHFVCPVQHGLRNREADLLRCF